MQAGARQLRNGRLKRMETVVQRQQRMLRKATMIASSSNDRTVEWASFGPVGRSATEDRFFHFATVFWLKPIALGQRSQALLTILYRSTDRLCRRGAAV